MSEKNLLENLPDNIDDMSAEQFQAYSDALAKGEIQEIGSKTEEETPGSEKSKKTGGEEETPEEKTAREAKEKEEADAKAKAELEAKGGEKNNPGEDDKSKKTGEDKNDPPSMPLSKYKRKKENWRKETDAKLAELEAKKNKEIEELKSSITSASATKESIEEDLKAFQEKHKIEDTEFMTDLVALMSKRAQGLDPETKKLLDEWKASKDADLEKSNQATEELEFEKDFNKTALPIIKKLNPEIDDEHLKEAKETLKKYAYDERYVKLTLEELISLKESKFKYNLEKKKTVESSRPGSQAGSKVNDYESWTSEDIDNASPEEFEKYSNHMAAKSGSGLKILDKEGKEVK